MPDTLYTFTSQSGIRRDGTELDSPYYADGMWVRFQRNKPRKMGGYRATSLQANGPVRHVVVDARNGAINAHYLSQWGIQRQAISASGAAGALDDRTPLVFSADARYTWSHGFMYSGTGSAYGAFIACATPDGDAIDSDATGNIYVGDATTGDPMTVVTKSAVALAVSGGITVLQPFLFAYGSNGLIMNSNANDFSDATGWVNGGGNRANTANVAGTKIIYGAPLRGGTQSPAGLFWSLDSLVRVSFEGGQAVWKYDPLATPASPLSKRAIVEIDGKFVWPAIDRFLMYTGIVQELPNDMNQNWFFDNLNYAARNKIWGTKIPRFGEIWWFYPRGQATECTDAIIYNYRDNTWYDAHLVRSAGDKAQTFKYPVWCGSEDGQSTIRLLTGGRGAVSAQTTAGIGTPSVNAPTSSGTGGTGLLAGTQYFYKISALSASGESLPSSEVSVTTAAGIVAPTLNTISTASTGGVGLSSGTTYYYKVTAYNGAGETTASNEKSITTAAGIAAPTATTISASTSGGTGLAASTQYFYKVTALNALGETIGSNELNVTTGAGLTAPTLSAPTTTSGGSMAANTTFYYKVAALNAVGETLPSAEQSVTTGGSTGSPVLNPAGYTIDGADPTGFLAGVTYFYKVTAVAATGESIGSNEISVLVPPWVNAPTLVNVPTPLALSGGGTVPIANYDCYVCVQPYAGQFINSDATYLGNISTTGGNQTIVGTWNLASRDDNGYVMLIRNTATGVINYASVPSGTGQIYFDGTFMGDWIGDTGKWPVTNDTSKGTVDIYWGTVGGATSYKLYRGSTAGGENLVKNVGNVNVYHDRGTGTSAGSPPAAGNAVALSWTAVAGATGYRVYRGTTAGGENVYYDVGNVTTGTDLGSPPTGNGSPSGTNTTIKPSITVNWNAVAGATGYNVYRGTAAGSENVKYALGTVTAFNDTGATGSTASPPGSNTTGGNSTISHTWSAVPGATGYRIYRGTTPGGESIYYDAGNVTSGTDVGGAPSGTAAPPATNTTASATSSVGLSWTAVPGATGYRVYRGTTSGGENVYYAPGAVTSYTDTGAAASAGSPAAHNTTSPTLTFTATPAGVTNGMTVYADPYLLPGTTVTAFTGTTVTLSDSPTSTIPVGTMVTFSSQTAIPLVGMTATGQTSGATGTIVRSSYSDLNLRDVTGTFQLGETIALSSGATVKAASAPMVQQLDAVYEHEFGFDKIVGASVVPIRSYFTSQNYGFAVGTPFVDPADGKTLNVQTRLTRMEPDFDLRGSATLIVEGRNYAQKDNKELGRFEVVAGQAFVDTRGAQSRILRITFESNTQGGFYEQGQVLMGLEPGDERGDE